MSGIGPAGWSYSLNYGKRMTAVREGPVPQQRPGGGSGMVMFGWVILRLVLGVDYGLMFELLGAFILSQTSYNGYDFRTHKRAEAILYIGTIGGIAMGLILIVFDTILGTRRAFADVEPGPPFNRPQGAPEIPNSRTTRNQAFLRLLLWPGLAALGGVVGIMIYHLVQNKKPRPQAQRRMATAAIVQIVGAAVSVSAPSIIQIVFMSTANANYGRKK